MKVSHFQHSLNSQWIRNLKIIYQGVLSTSRLQFDLLVRSVRLWTSRASGQKAMQARFRTVAMNQQFMYYDYSKIMLV